MALTKISIVLLLCLLGFYSETINSQNCGCPPDVCCSSHGYCGTTDAYCGPGCQSGPCRGSGAPIASNSETAYCGCSPILCCSEYGYCGHTDAYCGDGCRSGPCKNK